jgi:Flp pilus assembly protein TadD
VGTLDALAWALFRSGRAQEAREPLEDALAVGGKEASLLFRAGVVYEAVGDRAAARRRLEESLRVDPGSAHAAEARSRLARLKG